MMKIPIVLAEVSASDWFGLFLFLLLGFGILWLSWMLGAAKYMAMAAHKRVEEQKTTSDRILGWIEFGDTVKPLRRAGADSDRELPDGVRPLLGGPRPYSPPEGTYPFGSSGGSGDGPSAADLLAQEGDEEGGLP